VISKKVIGKSLILGGIAPRFNYEKEAEQEPTPGPGDYMPKVKLKKKKGSPEFISKTSRSEKPPKFDSIFKEFYFSSIGWSLQC